jgi:hypothetical protein
MTTLLSLSSLQQSKEKENDNIVVFLFVANQGKNKSNVVAIILFIAN